MPSIKMSHNLDNVSYDIRGDLVVKAKKLESEGQQILKLHIGNPALFGFEAPEEVLVDVIKNLPESQGYCDSKGLFSARKAIMQDYQKNGLLSLDTEDIYIGNGVSELIVMSLQALLNNDDELLIPSPDYPLWTAATNISGGKAVHYICDEQAGWFPDVDDVKSKISKKTKGIVLINPNNPTGAVYSKALLEQIIEIARQHNLIIFSDEIYSKIIYNDARHITLATLADDILIITFNGLSKAYRVCGFRVGWMIISGAKKRALNYISGLEILAAMRLCANVPMQHAIQPSLGDYQSINDLIVPGGRLYEQTQTAWKLINEIPGLSCTKPQGGLYIFPKLDRKRFNIKDDHRFALDLLMQEKILIVQGTGFNWHKPDHFRIVCLPHLDDLTKAIHKIAHFFEGYKQ